MSGTSDSAGIHPGRRVLPQRREHELTDFEWSGFRFTASCSRFPDGKVAEIFLNSDKTGTALDTAARDAAICASLLLQFGCPVETLRRALTRNVNGSASGPLGAYLDLLGQAGA